jgi:hypothetical protein
MSAIVRGGETSFAVWAYVTAGAIMHASKQTRASRHREDLFIGNPSEGVWRSGAERPAAGPPTESYFKRTVSSIAL